MESSTLTPHIYTGIRGWFDFAGFYREIAEWIPDGGRWVEVGVYSGKSFSFGIVECLNLGKKIDFIGVDMFPDKWIYHDGPNVFDAFQESMRPLDKHFSLIIGQSIEAATLVEDESADFVFIDAAHDYDSVKADIIAWTRKVKPGGIIAGHDYEENYPGLMQAVNEAFGDRVEKIPYDDNPNYHCWKVQR